MDAVSDPPSSLLSKYPHGHHLAAQSSHLLALALARGLCVSELKTPDSLTALVGTSVSSGTPNFDVHGNAHQKALCIVGTLAVPFRNAVYNFPIQLWLPFAFPACPPIVVIVPTSAMLIRPTAHVDASGRVYHPYLAAWTPFQSSLSALVPLLQDVFAQSPPLYSRPRPSHSPQPQSQSQPYYPLQSQNQPPPHARNQMSSQNQPLPLSQSRPQPLHLPLPIPQNQTQSHPMHQPQIQPHLLDQSQDPKLLLASLRSALKDKLTRTLSTTNTATTDKVESLLHHSKTLTESEFRTSDLLKWAVAEQARLTVNLESVKAQNSQLKAGVVAMKMKPPLNLDNDLTPGSALMTQLYTAVADDRAIADVIYGLTRALSTGRIDLSVFLKTTRGLAQQQFMQKVLIRKIRTVARLHPLY